MTANLQKENDEFGIGDAKAAGPSILQYRSAKRFFGAGNTYTPNMYRESVWLAVAHRKVNRSSHN